MRLVEWALIQLDFFPYKKGKFVHRERPEGCMHTQRITREDTSKTAGVQSQGERSQEKPDMPTP